MSTVKIEQGDTVIITDAAGIQYTLYDVFVSGQVIDHFAPEGDESNVIPVIDVTLSSFEFHLDSGTDDIEEE